MSKTKEVQCRVGKMSIPTYPEPEKEKLPMYCENRVHQRSNGKVYPNAVVNNVVRDRKIDKEYTTVILENDFIEVIILPEIGGRIFSARDKTNAYDFFYRQHVIKPALIGLFGSWISGGAEFNWPLHHRPSTFMPTDFSISNDADGGITVWLSEHEPLDRMKGMVGICIRPGKAILETKVRLYNRTPLPNSFLWWENIAVPVNRDYQIFFPPDVDHVHFHYKKSVAKYPVPDSMFNGIDYRDGDKDIRWHKNTEKSTSYFSARSNYDFFGGFDHGKNAGVVHVANHHISPGKKMFTWAYNQLSQTWENALTDSDGAYAELMAGCYTDNQPDFAWLEPYEVKEFSQFWYPIKDVGEPINANTKAALGCKLQQNGAKLTIYAVSAIEKAALTVTFPQKTLCSTIVDIAAAQTFESVIELPAGCTIKDISISLRDAQGNELISYRHTPPLNAEIPAPAESVPSPAALNDAGELYLAGLHLKQYRDPLVNPDVYWKKATEIAPGHYLSHNELGLSAFKEGRLEDAENHFRAAITALTRFNPNPRNGEAFYNLGLTLKLKNRLDEAYNSFYKAIWNNEWRSAGYYSLAQIDCLRGNYPQAHEHLLLALKSNADNQKAANLLASIYRLQDDTQSARERVMTTLSADPLDYWTVNELSFLDHDAHALPELIKCDHSQALLDLVFEYTGAGLYADGVKAIENFINSPSVEKLSPMVYYTYGWTLKQCDRINDAEKAWTTARTANPDYCFPSRLEEMLILREINDPRARYLLGNLLYGKYQYDAAINSWEQALEGGENYYALHRNLAMAYYNNQRDGDKALNLLHKAFFENPGNPQLLFELNYLMQLLNQPFSARLELLESNIETVRLRDDLYMELVRVHNQLGDCGKSVQLLNAHTFTPCEGGEHALLELWIFAHFKQGRDALKQGKHHAALEFFRHGQVFPKNLGAGIWNIAMNIPCMYYEARCLEHIDRNKAQEIYRFITTMGTDFFTYMYQPGFDYYRAMAYKGLNDNTQAETLLKASTEKWSQEKDAPDYGYFKATPFFLSYLEPQENVRSQHYNYLLALAYLGLENQDKAASCLDQVLKLNTAHSWAALEKAMM
jgi:tetratricopeptide (TPR) repeat protein